MIALISYRSQSQTVQKEDKQGNKKASNAQEALQSYDWMNYRIDTAMSKQDSLLNVYKSIERMKTEQENKNAKKPE